MPKIRSEKKSRVHQEVQKQGIVFNKDLGQHILKNPLVITTMIEKVSKYTLKSELNVLIVVLFLGCPSTYRRSS